MARIAVAIRDGHKFIHILKEMLTVNCRVRLLRWLKSPSWQHVLIAQESGGISLATQERPHDCCAVRILILAALRGTSGLIHSKQNHLYQQDE
jgi:hypothetical protein